MSFIKSLTAEELAQRHLVPAGRKHPVRARLEGMHIDDIIEIPKAAFRWKGQSPTRLVRDVGKKLGYKFDTMKDVENKSWVVKRVG